MKPIDRLAVHLQIHYPCLTIKDVALSPKPGFILVKDTREEISVQGAGYPRRDSEDGTYNSINRLWMELHDYFNAHVEVEKIRKTGLVTVIRWHEDRFSYDKNTMRKRD